MTKVSIGLPVYNGEDYLREALDSLLAQTFGDFELIISDNASTDGTQTICREYAAKDARIQYVLQERNRGAAYNYNRVFELSSGEYFKWASHDDLQAPELFSGCVEVLDQQPTVVLCYARTRIIDARGETICDWKDHFDLRSPRPHLRFRRFLRKPAGCNAVFGLMRADVLATTKLIQRYEASDHNLLAELCLRGQFWELPERLFYRRDHPAMSRRANQSNRDLARWFDPAGQGARLFPAVHVLVELIKCIRRAPITEREKLLCFAEIPQAVLILAGRAVTWGRKRNAGDSLFARSR